ncbi:Protein kinase domain - like 10 [Theobroma cacao]|nr:Protein kinase domain - like 10 [Theobroma cacao]
MASDGTIYVAVGELDESELTLFWTLHNLSPLKVCILHVHQPSKMISSRVDGNLAVMIFHQQQLRGLEEVGNDMMHRIMDDCVLFCREAGVSAEKLFIQRDDVAKGIVELIHRHNIKKLVMGAAAAEHFSERMWLMSEKAQYVNDNAPLSCQIWFICREQLVHKRFETGQSSHALSPSGSGYLTSSSEAAGILDAAVFEEREENECELDRFVLLRSGEDQDSLSMPNEGSGNDQLFDQLEQALQEAETSNRKAYEESNRRVKAEMDAVRAMRQAKAFERLYNERKRETEAALAKQKEELEKMKRQRDEEHLIAIGQKSILDSQVANSDYRIKQLEDQLSSAVEQLQISQKERDELQVELENTRKVTEELLRKQAEETSSTHMQQIYPDQLSASEIHDATLDQLQICQKEKDELQVELENTRKITDEVLRKQAEDTSSTHVQQPYAEFSLSEIQEATEDFDPSFKITEGTRGSVYYRCVLRHTDVAIKVLGQNSLQDPSEFQQEVDELSKSRHPNLVTLIGACPEIWAIIYEYLPNGSLEDRLNCRNDTPPLSSQTRINIATELCSTLMFLHSSKPQSVVHGNLKPGNILLDANFGCKLSDFGARRALSLLEDSSNARPYLDPDFRSTGRLSHSLDLYPFGIILLQLLSGRSTQGIAETAQNALQNLNSFLAIRCCDINLSRRPDLASDVLRVLETMRVSSGATLSFLSESDEDNREPPSYFICPILQEVMDDPHVAADGYTYEASALRGWLADHDSSPMTNLRLSHRNLVPNHALRSAIREWQQPH